MRVTRLKRDINYKLNNSKMSDYNTKGILKTILPIETGVAKSTGKEWKKITFVVTNNDGYEGREQMYAFEVFGEEKVDNFIKYNKEGTEVEVKFNIQTNEWNGKYFTSLSAYRVDSGEKVEQSVDEAASDNLPF